MIYLGAYFIGKVNFLFMIGLALAYCGLISFGIGHVNPSNLAFRPSLTTGVGIFSMILATFSYQMIVPSLCSQLNYDAKQLKKAIIIGTSLPCIVYTLWIFVIHGIVPLEGPTGLQAALDRGASSTEPLRHHFNHWSLGILADLFALFAVVTSYLGLSLALFYFLKDSFGELKITLSKNTIILSSLIPTLLLAMLFPTALVKCLDLSGGYGDTILSGLIPIAMVWMGRYKRGMTGDFRIPGGKLALVVAAVFYLTIFIIQMI
jgi:tyrosine-specific transport protein